MAPPLPHTQVGSGKVTDSQVAFMVECYLRDSHFSRALQEFRLEAARLLHPLRSVPKGARSLSAVLNDYVALKEEHIFSAAEKARAEDLFYGLQEILTVYQSGVLKSAGQIAETKNEALSPPPFPSPAGTQQPQIQVLCESEVAALPGTAAMLTVDQQAKEKVPSHKRKSQGKNTKEPQQHVESSAELVKKPRRSSNFKQLSSDPPAVGNVPVVAPNACPLGTDSLTTGKTVQPATPPIITISCKSQVHQQQAFLSVAMSESPQPPCLSPSEAAQTGISPKHTTTLLPSASGDAAQYHQDPQTPSPSSTKLPFNGNTSTCALAQEEEMFRVAEAPEKSSNKQQRRRALMSMPSVTSHYALRAHKKPAEASCKPLADEQPDCVLKPTRKKAINSKCRLLDFLAVAANEPPQVDVLQKQTKEVGSSKSPYSDPQQTVEFSVESLRKEEPNSCPASGTLPPQEFEATDLSLPCDAFSFEELFSLDLDTSLISELEDLAAITGCDTDLSCLRSSETAGLCILSDPSSGGVLTEIDNLIHADNASALNLRASCPSASPSKQRRPATMGMNGNSINDKENLYSLVASH